VTELESLPQDVSRSAYTQRILEIVGNIKKQKEEISKILSDTKELQKEINSLTGKLDRSFAVTDELVFKDAKKDESVRKSYKYLAALHENCNLLIQTIEDTGTILREIRDLEEQVGLSKLSTFLCVFVLKLFIYISLPTRFKDIFSSHILMFYKAFHS
ncbi:Coiled-coil domain-containing protein 22, partial [Xenotaenia resolanae]